MTATREDERAGAIEHFEDAALYDHEYRRRRDDVRFYRALAAERGGPVLDLACGTGRLMLPLLRDGHVVVGLDHAPAMLARAAAKIARLPVAARGRALLVRADLRRFAFQRLTSAPAARTRWPAPERFALAIAAFHSVQHLVTDRDLLAFLRAARRAIAPHGWLAFDIFAPEPRFLKRDEERRWERTRMRDPSTGARLIYTVNHHFDRRRRTLLMRMYYQPVDQRGRPVGPERVRRLCHRQLSVAEVRALLDRAGLRLIASWSDFAGSPLHEVGAKAGAKGGARSSARSSARSNAGSSATSGARAAESEQHVYLAKPR
jgi:SAM-dependent methyltransferase